MSITESIRRMLYKYGTSSVPSYKSCSCNKTLKNGNGNKSNTYTRKQRRTGRRRNKRRNRI
jgi:hypothetical protein